MGNMVHPGVSWRGYFCFLRGLFLSWLQLKLLMWLEELQHEIDVRQYDMQEVVLEAPPASSRLWLKVGGLVVHAAMLSCRTHAQPPACLKCRTQASGLAPNRST